jgi:hypothetical protein
MTELPQPNRFHRTASVHLAQEAFESTSLEYFEIPL